MKKALLASAALALSSTFAFAASSSSSTPVPNLTQSFTGTQTIGDIGGHHAESLNILKGHQTQFAIGGTPTLTQTGVVTQTIGKNTGGEALNKVILNQTQFSISAP